jgi:peptide/nickel transport system permease protein
MLKEAVRRLLWLGPTLLVATIPIFWAVSRSTDHGAGRAPNALPLFFNPTPAGARERALAALADVAAGGARAETGARELARIGGAALPHVLPRFDALGPDARGRVAQSLTPVARRMGIGSPTELESRETAVVFWSRFWEEHAIDFRPAVVRRTVRRFVEHPSALRGSEVSELDTVALEDLMDALGTVRRAEDAARVRHLADLAARMTEEPWTLPPGASVDAARAVADRWKQWWLGARSKYIAFTGPRRIAATVLETRYGHWLERLVRSQIGSLGTGRMATELRSRGPTTLALLLSGLFGGYPLAAIAGVIAAMRRRRATAVALSATAVVLTTVGVVGTAGVLAGWWDKRLAGACLAVALVTAAGSFRQRRLISRRSFELCHVRTELAFGAPPWAAALRSLRLTGALVAAVAVTDLPGLMTSSLVAEHVFALDGLGATTVRALQSGDQSWLLAVAVLGTLTVGVAQIGADLLLGALDPRIRLPGARRVSS